MKDKVEVIKDHAGFKGIKINDLIHLDLNTRPLAIHSYINEITTPINPFSMAGGDKYKLYYIKFHLDNSVVKCTYNDRELWKTILKGLE